MKDELKMFAGFFLGAAAGVLTGILLAPDSGKRTRRKILREVQDWEEDIGYAAAKKLKKAKRDLNDKVEDFAEKGKEKLKNLKDG